MPPVKLPTKGNLAALAVRDWCRQEGWPEPVAEYRFAAPERPFRFDLCWVLEKVALEFQGGGWTGGRHTRGKGFTEDCVKLSLAAVLGWRVLLATHEHVEGGELRGWLKRVFNEGVKR